MIQDLGESVFNNAYSCKRYPMDTDEVFVFKDREVLCSSDGSSSPISIPCVKSFDKAMLQFLFVIDEKAYYLYTGDVSNIKIDGFYFVPIQSIRNDNPRVTCFAGFTAYHLYSWYKTNRYCGQCGRELVPSDKERAMVCRHCHNVVYPKIAPAVIVGVTDGQRIVVTRYKDRPYRGLALIAGFCEIGETPEQTAVREVYEEVGLKIKSLKYFGSQPWGMDSNLLIGYFAEVDGDTQIVRDEHELALAEWIDRSKIETPDKTISLTKTMIKYFKEHGNS